MDEMPYTMNYIKRLPNFFCVGAQKAGTTTLHDILSQHPEIFLPKAKETKFFQRDSDYVKGICYYREYFTLVKSQKCIGEVDPEYLYFEKVPLRIFETLGENIKFVFILRNPVDRAYSHYLMSMRRGYETYDFKKAVEKEPERIKDTSNDTEYFSQKNHFSYINRGLYAKQIQRYLKLFKPENMHFILFEEDFLFNRKDTIKRLLDFLEVDSTFDLNINLKSNSATKPRIYFLTELLHKENKIKKYLKNFVPNNQLRLEIKRFVNNLNQKRVKKSKLEPQLRQYIFEKYFMEDIVSLERIVERDLSGWLPA